MPRSRFPCVVVMVALASLTPARAVLAADPVQVAGVLRAVDPQGRSVILKKTSGELLELRAEGTATVTLDGKAAALDALKPGMKVSVSYHSGTGTIRTLKVETEPVRLRISISKDGDCRIGLGRALPGEVERPPAGLVPITNWYSANPVGRDTGEDRPGSLSVQAKDPKKTGTMLVYPRAFRLPCTLSLDITQFEDAYLGVQFLTPSANFVVSVESGDDLRGEAQVVAVASSNSTPGTTLPSFGNAQKRLKVEKVFRLDEPDELRFRLPVHEGRLGDLFTLDAVVFSRRDKRDVKPSVTLRNVTLRARNERTLGLVLGVKQGKVVVEQVEPGGLAVGAGVKAGDVVVALNGNKLAPVADASGLTLAFDFGVKAEASLTLLRGGRERSVSVRLD